MPLRDTPERWGSVTQLLHWSVAVLILALIALGWIIRVTPLSPSKITLFYWHKSLGMLVLALVLVRLGWRAGNRPPPARDLSHAEAILARGAHIALYLLILAVPVTGWLINSASGIPFRIFWILPLPAIAPVSAPLEQLFKSLHLATSWALAVLIVGHVGAALRHRFLLHDGVLRRMLPQTGHRNR